MPSLFGLAPDGVYPAMAVTGHAVRSYRTLSPLPPIKYEAGGLLSVALSLGHLRRTLSGAVFPWSPDFPPPFA